MVKVLEETYQDPIGDEIDNALNADEERVAYALADTTEHSGADLTDGGSVNGANLFPTQGGVKQERGRAAARRAWDWQGSETLLPLAWNPDGNMHDGGRRYLRKRHCGCCGFSGFFKQINKPLACPECVFNNCNGCNRGQDGSKIIACFYLLQDDVPNQAVFYGTIPCFLPNCPRGGDRGFETEELMRIHARSRHRMEYAAHEEVLAASRRDDMDSMQTQINNLLAAVLNNPAQATNPVLPSEETHVHKYAGKKVGAKCIIEGCEESRQTEFAKRQGKRR